MEVLILLRSPPETIDYELVASVKALVTLSLVLIELFKLCWVIFMEE
jgi:hypothetical protein